MEEVSKWHFWEWRWTSVNDWGAEFYIETNRTVINSFYKFFL